MIKWSIVLVPFPFDDFSESKVRPALCLTTEIGSGEPDGTGLRVESIIRLHKMVTIPTSLIKRRLGKVENKTAEIISGKITELFKKSK